MKGIGMRLVSIIAALGFLLATWLLSAAAITTTADLTGCVTVCESPGMTVEDRSLEGVSP